MNDTASLFDTEALLSDGIKSTPPSFVRSILKAASDPNVTSFAGGLPNPISFPEDELLKSMERVVAEQGPNAFQYSSTAGIDELRQWVADRYNKRFGTDYVLDDVLITTGSQQILDLLGKVLLDTYGSDVKVRARAMAAAGSDARMSGCSLPVIINSGSGNQGMTCSLPVIEYGKELKKSEEEIYRALCVSNLVALNQKRYIGSLSAYCGAVCAAAGAGAGITYLCGGNLEQIQNTVVNTIADAGGIVCDGAKPSCAAKIATSLQAAILSHKMAMRGLVFGSGEGLVMDCPEDTIKAVGYVGRAGMKQTDVEILNLMIGKTKIEDIEK